MLVWFDRIDRNTNAGYYTITILYTIWHFIRSEYGVGVPGSHKDSRYFFVVSAAAASGGTQRQ